MPAIRMPVFLLLVISLLLAAAPVDAQKKRRGKRRAAPAPSAQAAEAQGSPGAQGEAAQGQGEGVDMVVGAEEAQAGDGSGADGTAAGGEAGSARAPEGGGDGQARQVAPAASAAAPGQAADGAQEPADDPELAAIRKELASLMDELVQARAMVSMLGKALFKTRVRIMLEDQAMPDQRVSRVAIYLDGAPVFRGDGDAIPSDPAVAVFEGFAAPGPHDLSIEFEHTARDNPEYRYSARNDYHFEVVREHRTDLRLVIDDDSDMAEDFADDREGQYELESRLEVQAEPLE